MRRSVLEKKSESSAKYGRFELVFVILGEGLNGDYDPNNFYDEELLRVDLYLDGDREAIYSCCTMCYARLSMKARKEILEKWVRVLAASQDWDNAFQRLTWDVHV
jgi:hypothetical protein